MTKNANKNADLNFDYVIFDSLSVLKIRWIDGTHTYKDLATLEALLGLVQDLEDDLDDGLVLEFVEGDDDTLALVDSNDLAAIEAELHESGFLIDSETPVLAPFYFGEISVCQHPEGWVLL